MKRRKWLAAALAVCLGTTANIATTWAGETSASSARYTIGDAGVTKASAASATSTRATTNVSNSVAQDCCEPCDACDPCACDDCCCGAPQWFVEGEALLWWRKSRSLPPLVTTSLPGTLPPDMGVLGLGSTRVLFGGENVDDGPRVGGRINFGRWLDADQCTGVGANFYMLEQEEINFSAAGIAGQPVIAIPFFDAAPGGGEDALVLNRPGFTDNGRLNVQLQNDVMGGDAYLRRLLYADGRMRIDAIGGYQFARIDDGLSINANYDDVVQNANLNQFDSFSASNEFHGGSLGVLTRIDNGRWSAKGLLKCGVGNMHQSVESVGQTVVTPLGGGPLAIEPRGLLVLPTNTGVFSTNEFAYIPEAKLNLGFHATENWTFGVGYSFIYFSDVATAGRAIDRQINPTQVPGPLTGAPVPSPANFANTSDFWVQGLNFSAEFAY